MQPHTEARWHLEPDEVGMLRDRIEQGLHSLEEGWRAERHPGAQVYVSRHGKPVVEYACGQARPETPMTPDCLTSWFSASKPVVAMAIALLYDRGQLDLDDRVGRYLPDFGAGKEACTLRHVLTHTGGFSNAVPEHADRTLEENLAGIYAYPAEYTPGSKAGYHSSSGWIVLAEIIRVVDGRPVEQFVREELFEPLAMDDSFLGIPPERQEEVRDRIAEVVIGHTERTPYAEPEFAERINNPNGLARVNPSGGIRGPARDLGRFYEMMLAGGKVGDRQLLDKRTVELFTACHRWGMQDMTLMHAPIPWGLGFTLYGNADIHRGTSRRVFSHSGLVSSVAFADPALGLVCVVITTGLLEAMTNARRLRDVNGPVVEACFGG